MTIVQRQMRAGVYPPVGRCIYCGADGDRSELKIEHIIPGGLGGRLELPASSCLRCEQETHAVEGRVLGHIYGISRAQLGVRREKKGKANWPSTFPLTMADAAGESAVQVVTEEHPALLRMINWPPAGALAGAELDDSGIKGAMMSGSSIKPGLVRKTAKVHRGKRVFLTTKTKVTVDDFARFLAKIGHSFAVAERGLGTFTPCLINAVLNEPPTHLASLVGGSIVPTPAAPDLHEIELREEITRRHTLLVVRIQLFADIGIVDPNGAITPMPSYDVVAGLAPRS